jgi:hypothetical protein
MAYVVYESLKRSRVFKTLPCHQNGRYVTADDCSACLGKFAVLQALWAREAGSKLRPGGGRVGYVAPSRACVTGTA